MADKKITQLTAHTAPIDNDTVPIVDSAAGVTKKVTWAVVKSTLKTYFDTLYATVGALASYVTLTGAQTVTNKRITKRVVTVTQAAAPTFNTDNGDVFAITGLAQAITSMTTNHTGTPVAGDIITFEITDNGTARAITWGTKFEASSVSLPTTTVVSTLLIVTFKWNTATSKWRCVGVV